MATAGGGRPEALESRAGELFWRLRRLRKMSAAEVMGRVRDLAVKQAWRARALRPRPPARLAVSWPSDGFAPPSSDELPLRVSAGAREAVLAQAHDLLAGNAPVLGRQSRLLGEEPDWFTDIRSGRRAPSKAYCFDIPYRDVKVVGEIKYVWEPSRHHHVTVLAAAYYLSGDERFAERAAGHLASWWRENPFLRGVHWTSGVELGIRLLSWMWTRRLLARWPGARAVFEGNPVFLEQLYCHQAYLAAFPSHGSSANNHLVAEVAGLFASSSAFPFFPESARWRAFAARLLEREAAAQTFADGLNRELATAYHGLTFELLLAAAAEDDLRRPLLSDALWRRLAAMGDALASIVDARLRPPRQGDDDGGFGLLVDGAGFDRWASLLAYAQEAFGRPPWQLPAPGGDLRSALLLWRTGSRAVAPRPAAPIRHFAGAGMVLLRDLTPGEDELWCRCDHGPLGFLSTAAHGHADALSIEVRHGGVELLADPGTYCYHGHDRWRAYFRSTLGHNTLEVDRLDQARAGGLFLWQDHPRSRLAGVGGLDAGNVAEWTASHDGYLRLPVPAKHFRTLRLERRARVIDIRDWLESAGAHSVRLAFHLGPRVACELAANLAALSWEGASGVRRARLELPSSLAWSLHRGEEDPLLGWHSAEFGRVEPAFVLIGEGTLAPGAMLHSRLAIVDEKGVLARLLAAAADSVRGE